MKEVSIKKNFIYSMGYQILILITPFITTPYVSRVLGADGIGIYSYTSSIMSYFTLVAALGTSAYGAVRLHSTGMIKSRQASFSGKLS